MFRNLLRNVINPLVGYSNELLERPKARIDAGVHGDLCHIKVPVPPMPPRIGRATLEDIPEELRCHILKFLSYTDILRCASTCRSMYYTVKSSVELQYLVELDAQSLIQVHPRPPTVSTAECLRILRDKANAWNSFDLDATNTPALHFSNVCNIHSVTHQQLNLSKSSIDADVESHTMDMKSCTTRSRWFDFEGSNPTLRTLIYMDPPQDLMVIIQAPNGGRTHDFKYRILFGTISTGEEHPLAHGSRVVAGRPASSEARQFGVCVSILGDRIAVFLAEHGENEDPYWSLHVSSWHQGGRSDEICVPSEGYGLRDLRFLTKEKLLALSPQGHIQLYDVEDLSKTPRLLARFILPVPKDSGVFVFPSVFHSSQGCARLKSPDDNWIWTTNPADRVISVMWFSPSSLFVISARIFFMNIPLAWFDTTSKDGLSVPWSSWGPQNSRCFDGEDVLSFGVGGSRVIRAVPFPDPDDSSFQLHMTDFNPSAVARGIGKVVREPTTTTLELDVPITTYLPFVEVVHDQCLDASLWNIVLDEEKMVILTLPTTESTVITHTEGTFFNM